MNVSLSQLTHISSQNRAPMLHVHIHLRDIYQRSGFSRNDKPRQCFSDMYIIQQLYFSSIFLNHTPLPLLSSSVCIHPFSEYIEVQLGIPVPSGATPVWHPWTPATIMRRPLLQHEHLTHSLCCVLHEDSFPMRIIDDIHVNLPPVSYPMMTDPVLTSCSCIQVMTATHSPPVLPRLLLSTRNGGQILTWSLQQQRALALKNSVPQVPNLGGNRPEFKCSGALVRPRNLVERMVFSVAFHTDFLSFLYLKMQSQNADKPVYYSTQILFGSPTL
jgi:hypothetical protein